MNRKRLHAGLIEHWHAYFENFQLSTKEFYEDIERRIKEREFPNVRLYTEEKGPYVSGKRLYLVVRHREYQFFICAAPFGKSYFISWWLHERVDEAALALKRIPIIGWFINVRKTLYQLDTEMLFKDSVKAVVKEAVEQLARDKGLRALSDKELLAETIQ